MNNELTELECVCSVCNGNKGSHTGEEESGWSDCYNCNGSGYVPTEAGKRILDLMRHNSRVKVTAELCLADA